MYLAIPASSAQNERGFSCGGFLLGNLRSRLSMSHFRQEFRVRQFINSGPTASAHSKEGREFKMERVDLIIGKYTASLCAPTLPTSKPLVHSNPSKESSLTRRQHSPENFQFSKSLDQLMLSYALEFSKSDRQPKAVSMGEHRERLDLRIQECGLKYKKRISGDGNCQFASVSNQLENFGVTVSHEILRQKSVAWLRLNGSYVLANGSKISDFLSMNETSWNKYCDGLAKPNAWGDHLSLIALSQLYQLRIVIISSVRSEDYITIVTPLNASAQEKTLLLGHLHESHYDSLEIF